MDKENKTAIFFITKKGFSIAEKLKGLYPNAKVLKFRSEAVKELWNECKNLIFIMATGIVVRTIAHLIKNKKIDPAVVVLDERGKYAISLLSGHIGGANVLTKEIADFLNGDAVITTASDVNNLTAIDLLAIENNLAIENIEVVPHIGTIYLDNGTLRVYTEIEMALPEEFLKVTDPRLADILITNKKDVYLKQQQCLSIEGSRNQCHIKGQLYLRPKNLIVGIGCNSNTTADEIEGSVKAILDENNLSFLSIHSIATINIKANEIGLKRFAKKYGFKINTFTADEINSVKGISKSEVVFKATGANAVSEPAALLASKTSNLLIQKQRRGNVTIAVAENNNKSIAMSKELKDKNSSLYIVGTGPGSIEHITPYAQDAIRRSDVIIGYGTYLDLIQGLIKDKEIISTGMTEEIDRCKKAVELALSGKIVSIISGGDPGIYAMAGLVLEILKKHKAEGKRQRAKDRGQSEEKIYSISNEICPVSVEVIPGIPALSACAAKLGAPLMHDFACISLSDRLTPWELIAKRLESTAKADFVIVLYNPKSKGRVEHINRARELILKHRPLETPVGIVRAAMRSDEDIVITNLKDMLNYNIDMQTTIIIGNSQTFIWKRWMVTPRGYKI